MIGSLLSTVDIRPLIPLGLVSYFLEIQHHVHLINLKHHVQTVEPRDRRSHSRQLHFFLSEPKDSVPLGGYNDRSCPSYNLKHHVQTVEPRDRRSLSLQRLPSHPDLMIRFLSFKGRFTTFDLAFWRDQSVPHPILMNWFLP